MEIVLSEGFEQLSLREQEYVDGGQLQKGDFNKAAAACAVSAAVCPEFAAPLVVASAAFWLADAVLPSSYYAPSHSHSSGSSKF